MEKSRFYFTFGTDGRYPFQGGWVEVIADDMEQAINLYNEKYPKLDGVFVNCAKYYTEEQFKKTGMFVNGNFGAYCHEVVE